MTALSKSLETIPSKCLLVSFIFKVDDYLENINMMILSKELKNHDDTFVFSFFSVEGLFLRKCTNDDVVQDVMSYFCLNILFGDQINLLFNILKSLTEQ